MEGEEDVELDGAVEEETEYQVSQEERDVLLAKVAWNDADAEMIVLGMCTDDDSIDAALCILLDEDEASVAVSLPATLSASACRTLRDYADEFASACPTVDVMDGQPECQVEIGKHELERLIGHLDTDRLWVLPQVLETKRSDGQPTLPPIWLATASLRKYSPAARTHLGFHVDSDHCTANVCLSPSSAHSGGNLLLAVGGSLKQYPREEGDVTLHVGDVAHAVTAVHSGTRYSLLLFYNRPGFLFQRSGGRFRKPSSAPSG
eukprot:CAMPEP_0179429384 /NCGR_PEP_ID=MMETSP0799-20121207/14773_1 /TAXON_ID=46947 /ORGANISM="Geminigera cryophila, Strain CCMP2564" /LENGTH=261 /DNA_ID=CAMNT_0021205259 /DNA_START=80 /DNA_END=865 /DNA_ORIENTATION=-